MINRRIRRPIIIAVASVFGSCVCFVIFLFLISGQNLFQFFGPSPKQVQQLGQPLVDEIQAYQEINGVYPPSLEDIDAIDLTTIYGPFGYRLFDSGEHFELTNGDYGRDGFTVYYSSRNGRWLIDQ